MSKTPLDGLAYILRHLVVLHGASDNKDPDELERLWLYLKTNKHSLAVQPEMKQLLFPGDEPDSVSHTKLRDLLVAYDEEAMLETVRAAYWRIRAELQHEMLAHAEVKKAESSWHPENNCPAANGQCKWCITNAQPPFSPTDSMQDEPATQCQDCGHGPCICAV